MSELVYNEEGFYRFIAERHQVWVRRAAGKSAPWTDDPTLQRYHFCNVFRVLDRGTIWYIQNVLPVANGPEDLLWRTVWYRLVNNTQWFGRLAALGLEGAGVPSLRSWLARRPQLVRWMDSLGKPSTPAHISLQRNSKTTRFQNLMTSLESLEKVITERRIHLAGVDFQQDWRSLQKIEGVAGFTALQIVRDLKLAGYGYDEDAWCFIGPGAAATLTAMYGDTGVLVQQRQMKELTDKQRSFYPRGKAPLLDGNLPNLCDIEHSLCEYGKYVKYSAGKGRIRMYRPGGF